MAEVDFDVLHDDSYSLIDVQIGGRVYARSFDDQQDGFQVFEVGLNLNARIKWKLITEKCSIMQGEEGNVGPALVAYYIDEAGIDQVHITLDGGRVIVTSCGEGCHIKGDLATPTGLRRQQFQQKSAKMAKLRLLAN